VSACNICAPYLQQVVPVLLQPCCHASTPGAASPASWCPLCALSSQGSCCARCLPFKARCLPVGTAFDAASSGAIDLVLPQVAATAAASSAPIQAQHDQSPGWGLLLTCALHARTVPTSVGVKGCSLQSGMAVIAFFAVRQLVRA
jgi:hypothetical protein